MRFVTPSLLLAVALAGLLLAGCVQSPPIGPQEPVACTEDAKICPDGSAVGRVGPNCEFAPCPTDNGGEEPRPSGSTFREYKSQDVQTCMVMRFTCGEDSEYFGDETGCGCLRQHSDAAVTLCPADYDPVCGWNGDNIQCFAYPCAETKSNLCMASIDPQVAYTTPGECPAVGSNPERKYVSTSQTQCAASMWICVEGMQQFYDETGCGCEPEGSSNNGKKQAIDCDPNNRPEICTREYMPVCGQSDDGTSETYGNKCTACSEDDVLSYTEGACSTPNDNLGLVAGTECTNPRPEACTMQYDPVCARKADGSQATYGNACSACGDAQVQWHSAGECGPEDDNVLK